MSKSKYPITLEQLLAWLDRIAEKNNDEFIYDIRLETVRTGGIDYLFRCREIYDQHEFISTVGSTIEEAVNDAWGLIEEACDEWSYQVVD